MPETHPNSLAAISNVRQSGGDEAMYARIIRIIGDGKMSVNQITERVRDEMGDRAPAMRNVAARVTEMVTMGMLREVGTEVANTGQTVTLYENTFTRTKDKYEPKNSYKRKFERVKLRLALSLNAIRPGGVWSSHYLERVAND